MVMLKRRLRIAINYAQEHKTLTISAISALLTLFLIAGIAMAMIVSRDNNSDPGTQYYAIPTDSRDYQVEEAPVGRVDIEDEKTKKKTTNKDMAGNKVKHNPKQKTDKKLGQIPNIGQRFKVESVGLDVPLGKVNEVDGLIKPTNYTSVFNVSNRGVAYNKTNTGTTYIVTHALDKGGVSPGNFLIDANKKESRLNKGTIIYAGDKRFKVTKSFRAGKDNIAQNNHIWDEKIKGRMVIITCFPDSNDNQVIIAQRDWGK